MNDPEAMGLKTLKDQTVRIKAVGGPAHGGEIRVWLDDEFRFDGTVTLPYKGGRVEIYRLSPPLSKRSSKWCLVHDVLASDETST